MERNLPRLPHAASVLVGDIVLHPADVVLEKDLPQPLKALSPVGQQGVSRVVAPPAGDALDVVASNTKGPVRRQVVLPEEVEAPLVVVVGVVGLVVVLADIRFVVVVAIHAVEKVVGPRRRTSGTAHRSRGRGFGCGRCPGCRRCQRPRLETCRPLPGDPRTGPSVTSGERSPSSLSCTRRHTMVLFCRPLKGEDPLAYPAFPASLGR